MTIPSYQLRMSSKAKHARIIIKPSRQVEVVLPRGMPIAEADRLVVGQRAWIERTLVRMQNHMPELGSALPKNIELLAIDELVQVVYVAKQKKPLVWNKEGLQLSICSDEAAVPELLRNWLKKLAKEHLPVFLEKLAWDMQLDYRAVSIRLQKTRWGSCSVQGNISLNAKLLLLPPELLRYVLVHELSHLKHMNHSADFWQYVGRFEPNYHQRRAELRQLSMVLPAWLYA